MENACAFHMLRPANENRSESRKPDASDLLLGTNSVANTIALLTYVVLPSILQSNRSWPQTVRLLNASAFSDKACQHSLGTAKKSLTCFFFFLYTCFVCKASISSFITLESCFSFDLSLNKSNGQNL